MPSLFHGRFAQTETRWLDHSLSAAGIPAGGEVVAQRSGEGGDALDDGAAFGSFGAHGDVCDGFFGGDAGLVLAADGDGDFAHG